MQSSDPVVTDWDETPPSRDERAVGSWRVTPQETGISTDYLAQGETDIPIPDDVKQQLKEEALATGETSKRTASLRYTHDLDTHETDHDLSAQPSTRAQVERLLQKSEGWNGNGNLDAAGERFLARYLKNQQVKKLSTARRRSARRREKQLETTNIPEIIVFKDGPNGGPL